MDGRKKQLIFALVIAVVAVFANKAYIDSQVDRYKPGKLVTVLTAKKGVPAGTTLRRKQVKTVKVPAKFAPNLAISKKELDQFLGQELMVDVPRGDYILENYFSERRAVGNKLSAQVVGENTRAITLPVDQTDSLAGSIVTGDLIDLVFTFSAPGITEKFSMLLLQSVPVISTGSYSVVDQEIGARGGKAKKYNTLTLLLPVTDAMRLNFARQVGKIDILLRNSADSGSVAMKPISGVIDLLTEEQRVVIEQLKAGKALSDEEKARLRKQLQGLFNKQQRATRGR